MPVDPQEKSDFLGIKKVKIIFARPAGLSSLINALITINLPFFLGGALTFFFLGGSWSSFHRRVRLESFFKIVSISS